MPLTQIYQTYAVSLTASDMILRVGRLLRHRAASFFKSRGIDLTPEQWSLLLKLAEKEGQTQGSLADPASMTIPISPDCSMASAKEDWWKERKIHMTDVVLLSC